MTEVVLLAQQAMDDLDIQAPQQRAGFKRGYEAAIRDFKSALARRRLGVLPTERTWWDDALGR